MAWFKCAGGGYTDYSNQTVTTTTVTSDSDYTYLSIPSEGLYNTGSKVRTLNSNLGPLGQDTFSGFLEKCELLASDLNVTTKAKNITVPNLSAYRWLVFVSYKSSDGYSKTNFRIPDYLTLVTYNDFKTNCSGNLYYYGIKYANRTDAGGYEAIVAYVSDTTVSVDPQPTGYSYPFYIYGIR